MKNSFYKELSEMAQEAIEELNRFEQMGKNPKVFDCIRRIGVPCFDGQSVKRSLLDDLPLREQINFSRAVSALISLNTLSSSSANMGIRSHIEYVKHWATELSNRSKRIGTPKVFYSWQATLPGSANRNLIKASLTKAIDELNKEFAIEDRDEATLDSDTANTPGAPDIIRTILAKVDAATIFVADITLVNETQPNANVMFELGYAIKAIGESNIILLFNEHYGSTKDLPFDLGLKRAMLYRCDPESEDKASVRKELAGRLENAINVILKEPAD
ncbi:hypothetical protein F3J20_11855 [Paraburkholderia sp. Cy-641]|uniref:TIR domain-containing protein n=1 Tax=Paraburkholderia sp. Cy-641 TaxID=2608337 RepID=UPI00141FD639|nr:TIR domain-containing protein [Paraburkholderia sp. Cy-641]NIF78083.1 hypothetical protein [Paraburkholderia sp. Cy-641]